MQTDIWQPELFRHGLFKHFVQFSALDALTNFPDCYWLNQHFGCPGYRYIPQDETYVYDDLYYEEVVYLKSAVPTRQNNWHDFFNAFIWHMFPKTKSLLNKLHYQDIEAHGLKQRTKRRNALTLFDECGVVIACCRESDKEALRQHQWQQVFFDQRQEWGNTIDAFMFGHANYQMALAPFDGLTGKAFFVDVEDAFFKLPLAEQYQYLDLRLLQMIAEESALEDNKLLSPMPFLGIPGWYEANQRAEYYANTDYFRPKRKTR